MTNEDFIIKNREKDIRALALRKMPEGVDAHWCLRQIEGYQLAKKKLPLWTQTEGLHYPPRLSMEQCSSEATAIYKQQLLSRLLHNEPFTLTDLTGGFGVDFSYMAKHAERAVYVEQQEGLCAAAAHNMPLLNIPHATIINDNAVTYLDTIPTSDEASTRTLSDEASTKTVFFLDPARRDDAGRKMVSIEDCTPNVLQLQDELLRKSHYTILKLSPMLDITQALRNIHNVIEVHVISVKGECKELIFVLSAHHPSTTTHHPSPFSTSQFFVAMPQSSSSPNIHCVNLNTPDAPFIHHPVSILQRVAKPPTTHYSAAEPIVGQWLFEPNASILKAGVQNAFAAHYKLSKLHPQSNLFIGEAPIPNIPARAFRIIRQSDFSKASIKNLLKDIKQANITIRNFPSTVQELRKRLKLNDGGDTYLFATTINDNSHRLLLCKK